MSNQNKTLQEQINEALSENIALSTSEMKRIYEEADRTTRRHGVRGCGAKDERRRLRRMTMNYYGTELNVLCSLLASTDYMCKLMQEQNILLSGIYKKLEEGDKTQ
jgi:hypothetical protein